NARELYHMVELRSTVQGHSDYRRIAIKMLEEAKKATPEIMAAMKFVQAQGVELERLQAEKWTDKQIEAVEKKYSKK
ncbi:MAG: FAD-dependent thymidylate synthase, partial [Candidatus Diapherotrites archaeon]|nr:FAD-dependent thymidylate synthase [Candidatus Diapherotrites archaeon]